MSTFEEVYDKWGKDYLKEQPTNTGMGTPAKPMTGATDPTQASAQTAQSTQQPTQPAQQTQATQPAQQGQAIDPASWDQYSQQDIVNYLAQLDPQSAPEIISGLETYMQQMKANQQQGAVNPASTGGGSGA